VIRLSGGSIFTLPINAYCEVNGFGLAMLAFLFALTHLRLLDCQELLRSETLLSRPCVGNEAGRVPSLAYASTSSGVMRPNDRTAVNECIRIQSRFPAPPSRVLSEAQRYKPPAKPPCGLDNREVVAT
jgi:hypothetical protein